MFWSVNQFVFLHIVAQIDAGWAEVEKKVSIRPEVISLLLWLWNMRFSCGESRGDLLSVRLATAFARSITMQTCPSEPITYYVPGAIFIYAIHISSSIFSAFWGSRYYYIISILQLTGGVHQTSTVFKPRLLTTNWTLLPLLLGMRKRSSSIITLLPWTEKFAYT